MTIGEAAAASVAFVVTVGEAAAAAEPVAPVGLPSATLTQGAARPCVLVERERALELALSSNSRKYPRGRSAPVADHAYVGDCARVGGEEPHDFLLGHSYGKLPTNAVKGGEDGTGIVGRTGRASLPAVPGIGASRSATPLVDAPGPGGDAPKRKPAPPGDVGPENRKTRRARVAAPGGPRPSSATAAFHFGANE